MSDESKSPTDSTREIAGSPELLVRRVEHKYDIENQREKTRWKSCLGCESDSRLLNFSMRAVFSIIAIIFAGTQIVLAHPCDGMLPFYSSLITFILGSWFGDSTTQKKQKAPR